MEEISEEQPSEVITPDTENATYFDPYESNDRSQHFKRLRLYNRNTWKDRREENKEVTHRQDNLAILDALSGGLSLNSFQKKKCRRIFDKLDLQEIGKSVRLVAFGVCACVANDDVHDGTRYYPTSKTNDDQFEGIVDDLEFTDSQIHNIIGVIQHRRP